jgi:flagellar export protein FliJ
MTTPYGPLLSLRELEERQAEIRLAESLQDVATAESEVTAARDARDAWLRYYLEEGASTVDPTGLGALLTRLEDTERAASRRLESARQRAEAARVFMLEQRRQREAVETLHENVLDAAAQLAQRRLQAELDGLGGMAVSRREASDAD